MTFSSLPQSGQVNAVPTQGHRPPDLPPLGVRARRHMWTIATLTLSFILAIVMTAIGGHSAPTWILGPIALIEKLLSAGGLAGAILLASFGLSGLLRELIDRQRILPGWLDVALGPALLMLCAHVLGQFGLLSGPKGQIVALALLSVGALGLLLRAVRAVRTRPPLPSARWPVLLAAPALAVLMVASASPPGALWSSEFGAFDAMSYHLALPQQWVQQGPMAGELNNVYSFLPMGGFVQSLFLVVAAVLGGGLSNAQGLPVGLVASEGLGGITCQFLHAGMAILTAGLVGRLVWGMLLPPSAAGDYRAQRVAAMGASLAASAYLAAPWSIVTASLAYNEHAVNLMFIGTLLLLMEFRTPVSTSHSVRLAILAGLLTGAACACKPTAALFCVPTIALAGAVLVPMRRWLPVAVVAGIASLLALGPVLIRCALATGNPIFPFATGLFGSGHWTSEQAARFAAGHSVAGGPREALRLLWEVAATPGEPNTPRGLFHPQWLVFFPLSLLAGMLALICPARRATLLMLASLGLMLVAWIFFTHAQARFLLPALVPGAVLAGLGASAALDRLLAGRMGSPARLAIIALSAAIAALSAWTLNLFMREGKGRPASMLVLGGGFLSGEAARARMVGMTDDERDEFAAGLEPVEFVNIFVPPDETVYLLGESRPYYFTRAPRHILWHTTWDRSPLGEVIGERPNQPEAWGPMLQARGVRWILVNAGEIDRLQRSGWYDPRVTALVIKDLADLNDVVRRWDDLGVMLIRLDDTPVPPARPILPAPPASPPAPGVRASGDLT